MFRPNQLINRNKRRYSLLDRIPMKPNNSNQLVADIAVISIGGFHFHKAIQYWLKYLNHVPLQAFELRTFPIVFGKSPNPPFVSTSPTAISSIKFVTDVRIAEARWCFCSDECLSAKQLGTRLTIILFVSNDSIEISSPNFRTLSKYWDKIRTVSGGNSRRMTSSRGLEITWVWDG